MTGVLIKGADLETHRPTGTRAELRCQSPGATGRRERGRTILPGSRRRHVARLCWPPLASTSVEGGDSGAEPTGSRCAARPALGPHAPQLTCSAGAQELWGSVRVTEARRPPSTLPSHRPPPSRLRPAPRQRAPDPGSPDPGQVTWSSPHPKLRPPAPPQNRT